LVSCLVAAALVFGLGPVALAAEHEGSAERLTCADIDPAWSQLGLTGHPISGHYVVEDAERTVEIVVYDGPAGGKLVNWKSDGPISAVIMSSGQDAAVYEYEPPQLSATGLLPPIQDREGRNLAAVLVCYDPGEIDVRLELRMADSEDPVSIGDVFDYLLEATVSEPVTGGEIAVTLPSEVTAVTARSCQIEGATVTCLPDLGPGATWTTTITVEAMSAGDAIARALLTVRLGDEERETTAVETTRILAGEGGGCADEEEEEGCDGGGGGGGEVGHDLAAVCLSLDSGWSTLTLPGPFASRRYLVQAGPGMEIWVTIRESMTGQQASWSSNVPIDAALARTGQDVEIYRYDFPTFSGTGVMAPRSGGGSLRPMADIGFCYQPRRPIDLGITVGPSPALAVDRVGLVTALLEHLGYVAASATELHIETSENLSLRFCGGALEADQCRLGGLDVGATLPVDLGIEGLAAGPGWIRIEASAVGAGGLVSGEVSATFDLMVAAASDAVVTTSPMPTVDAELPLTGPADHGPTTLVAMLLVGLGVLLLLASTEQDVDRA
jgi:hypothetical protein